MTESLSGNRASCANCPSRMPEHTVQAVFAQNVGADVCRQFGHVLGRTGLTSSQHAGVMHVFAAACPLVKKVDPDETYYPAEPLTEPARPLAQVAMVNPDALATATEPEGRPLNCRGCVHFVPKDVVYSELGWTAPMCSATGRLLFDNRLDEEAAVCVYGKFGDNRDSTEGITLLKKYDDAEIAGVAIGTSLGAHVGLVGDDAKDPSEYVSDLPVSDEDRADGIRAWEIVHDPSGYGKDVTLPIKDLAYYTDEIERLEVPMAGEGDSPPELYVDHASLYYQTAALMVGSKGALSYSPMFLGDAGGGKTEFGRYFAWRRVLPFHRIACRASTTYDELFGTWLYVNDETRFKPGRIVRAYARDGVIMVDEANTLEPELWQSMRPMTDDSKLLVLDNAAVPGPDGNLVTPPPVQKGLWNFLMFSGNHAWDPKYTGVEELSGADKSRIAPVHLDFPPETVERGILARRYLRDTGMTPKPKMLDDVMKIANELRSLAAQDGGLPISWGIREQIKVIRFLDYFPPRQAYRRAVADFLEPATRNLILGVVDAQTAGTSGGVSPFF